MRVKVFSWVRYRILMYCWVIVDPPPDAWCPPVLIPTRPRAARNRPVTETPGSVQKLRFSAATTASLTYCGIWA